MIFIYHIISEKVIDTEIIILIISYESYYYPISEISDGFHKVFDSLAHISDSGISFFFFDSEISFDIL